ncbi:MAG: response regulator [Anaerolineae bacterium]|nr:response regulator [Anaerolineae bacterium]
MPKRLLVVNDRREILELFDQIIPKDKYELFLYSYGMGELKAVEHLKPDLIILDFTVGQETDGWQLLQKVKMLPDAAATPVIICTMPTTQVKETEGYLATQEVFVVAKPFKAEVLLETIRKALRLTDQFAPDTEQKAHDA